jgi:hypothetical protein
MADAEMAANLTAHLAQELRHKHGLELWEFSCLPISPKISHQDSCFHI